MKMLRLSAKIVSLSLLGLGLMSQVTWAQGSGGHQPSYVPGRILVKFKDGVGDGQARGLLAGRGALSASVIPEIGVHIVQLPPNTNEQAEANAFKGLAGVEFAQVDQILAPSSIIPNDPYDYLEWHLTKIAAPDAWSVSTGTTVVIAIVDTGVDGTHQDLSAKMVAGWNVVDGNTNTSDASTHGTTAAGTAAAATNNGIGSAGVCWGCKIMPVRVTDDTYGFATSSNVAAGITWAANHGARIAAVGYALTNDPTVTAAAQAFYNGGGAVIMPSGNDGTVNANADNPYVLTVGATDPNNVIYSFSTTGTNLDLVAPGCNAVATSPNNGYAQVCGTSMSGAVVAGVAGLVLSVNSALTPAQVTSILKQSVDDLGTAGWDPTYGTGRINALKAVNNAATGGGTKTNTTTTLVSSLNPSISGQTVIFTATVSPSAATGTVTFMDGAATLGTGTLSGGVASFSTTSLTVGSHSITASYGGDGSYNGSASTAVSQVVNTPAKTNTTTGLISGLNPSILGNLVVFTATLNPLTATGTVTFFDGATNIGSGSLVAGIATLGLSNLSVGSHSVTATYSGDSNYNGSTSIAVSQNVNKAATTTGLTSSLNPSTSGQSVTFTATVSPSAATGTVTFLDGATTLGTSNLSGGAATFATSSLAVGSHSITARYDGDGSYSTSTSAAVSQTVNPPAKTNTTTGIGSSLNPSNFGLSVTFTATVTPSAATGTVTFFDGGVTLGSANVSGGVATLSTSALTAGSHSITATYNGDASYNGSTSGALSQTVNKANTSTGLTSSVNPSNSGQSVTFTATVSPATASGTVTFLDGATTLSTSNLSGGTATFVTSTLVAGSHSITARYNGDGNYNTSTSAAVSQTVNPPAKTNTTTGIGSNLNPSSFGLSVTFTATVTPSAATGTVTFFDGGVTLGSGNVSGGVATLSTSALTAGSHSITATYNGDASDNGSTSGALSQTVNKANTSTGLASSLNPSNSGQSVTFTATVSPATASGTVTFFDGGVSLGSSSLSGGVATLSTAGLAAGSHSIIASYGGNGNYNGSTSSVLSQTVNLVDQTPPTAPANLANDTLTKTTVPLKWNASTDNVGVAGYKVFRAQSGKGKPKPPTQIATTPNINFMDTTVRSGVSYTYTVYAYDGAGNTSNASNTLTLKVP